ncbi:MAG: hypothetical protein ABI668_12125 [Sphingorhabdus sp.]
MGQHLEEKTESPLPPPRRRLVLQKPSKAFEEARVKIITDGPLAGAVQMGLRGA